MSQSRIRNILQSRLAAWAAARAPALPVMWENVRAPEPTGDHLRAFVLPATTLAPYLAGDDRTFIGIFQVSIFTVAGTGAQKAELIASELDALFPCTEVFTDAGGLAVQVMTPVSLFPLQIDDGMAMLATSFRYQARAA